MNELSPMNVENALSDPRFVEQLQEEVAAARRELTTFRRAAEFQRQIASQVHRSLLPRPIRHSRLNVDVRYLPIEAVGGDYCQVRFPDPSSCYVTMCDAAWHGIGPSLLAARVSSEVRHFIMDCLSPSEIVRSLNDFILEYFRETQLLLSFIAAQIDLNKGTITYSGARHPAILHLRPGKGLVEPLSSQNMVIGVDRECLADQPEDTRSLASGDRLVFYTDGITETTNSRRCKLGEEGLARIASYALSVDLFNMADKVFDQVSKFRFGPPRDDMTLIALEMR